MFSRDCPKTTRKNLSKWSIAQSSAGSFCLQYETLQHIVSSCKLYLGHGRYTWRHDSVLNFIAKTFSVLLDCSLFADLPAFPSSSLIKGNSFRHDLILITKNNILYTPELTIGFETNIKINSERKASKYYHLQQSLHPNYNQIRFIIFHLALLDLPLNLLLIFLSLSALMTNYKSIFYPSSSILL